MKYVVLKIIPQGIFHSKIQGSIGTQMHASLYGVSLDFNEHYVVTTPINLRKSLELLILEHQSLEGVLATFRQIDPSFVSKDPDFLATVKLAFKYKTYRNKTLCKLKIE